MKKFIFASFAFIAIAFNANAQTASANASQTVTLTLQNQIDISVGNANGTTFLFQSPSDYTSGLTNTSASTFHVRSNRPWAVTVRSETATFNGPNGNSMPSDKLGVRLNGGTAFTQLTTSAANFTAGFRGTHSFTVDYNANPGFDFDAGTYTINVVYTATQQ